VEDARKQETTYEQRKRDVFKAANMLVRDKVKRLNDAIDRTEEMRKEKANESDL